MTIWPFWPACVRVRVCERERERGMDRMGLFVEKKKEKERQFS